MKAVDAWRNRGKDPLPVPAKSEPSGTGTGTGSGAGAGVGSISGGQKGPFGASASALAMAAKIAAELETEQLEFKLKMKEQKERLEAAFKATDDNRRKEEKNEVDRNDYAEEKNPDRIMERGSGRSSEKGSSEGTSSESKGDKIPSLPLESKYSVARTPNLSVEIESKNNRTDRDDRIDRSDRSDINTRGMSPRGVQTPRGEVSVRTPRQEVSVLESTMGLPDLKTQEIAEASYLVDEGSDED